MNRIATTLTLLTAPVLLVPSISAQDSAIDQINSRLIAIESRLSLVETNIGGDESSSYSYQQNATIEATKGMQSAVDSVPDSKKIAPTAPTIPSAPVPARESSTYVIKDGDTLGSISRKHEIERAELLTANRLSEGQPIYIGETLLIPGTGPIASTQTESTKVAKVNTPAPAKEKSVVVGETRTAGVAGGYTVKKGDTLTGIARKNSTTVAMLKSANGLKSDVISLGQSLTIPAASSPKPAASTGVQMANHVTTAPEKSQDVKYEYENELLSVSETYGYYKVNKGDNLYALARDFFTTMAELQRVNRLGSSTLIYPGNELIVPTGKYNSYHNNGNVAQR